MPLPKDPSKVDDYKRRIGLSRMMTEFRPPFEVQLESDTEIADFESLSKKERK
jgi:hypothetical protein